MQRQKKKRKSDLVAGSQMSECTYMTVYYISYQTFVPIKVLDRRQSAHYWSSHYSAAFFGGDGGLGVPPSDTHQYFKGVNISVMISFNLIQYNAFYSIWNIHFKMSIEISPFESVTHLKISLHASRLVKDVFNQKCVLVLRVLVFRAEDFFK